MDANDDDIPEEALEYLDKLAKMHATFTHRRKKQVLRRLRDDDY